MAYFKNINLYQYRNFETFEVEFSQNCNVLYGQNGCGKTNLLEAFSIFKIGRGLRKDKIVNFIQKDKNSFLNTSTFL